MENSLPKIKASITGAPIGAAVGAVTMYLVAKRLGYHKSITVVPFTVVGLILGSVIGASFRK